MRPRAERHIRARRTLAMIGSLAIGLLAIGIPAVAAAAQRVTVTIGDHDFVPRHLVVRVGTLVTWKSLDLYVPHTVTSGRLRDDGRWKRGLLFGPGQTFSHRFSQPGRFEYHDDYHIVYEPDSYGTIDVKP